MSNFYSLPAGLLVNMATSVRGNVKYFKETVEYANVDADTGHESSEWNTRKIVFDPEEQERAAKLRDRCRSLINGVCSPTNHNGLLCPLERADELERRMEQVNEWVAEFNADAVYTRVAVHIFPAEIAQNDLRAAKGIFNEIGEHLEEMQAGLAELDTKKVRAVCSKVRNMGQMLSADASGELAVAIETARASCREIVKAGESVVMTIDRDAIERIDEARTAFLDFGGFDDIATPVMDGVAVEYEAV
jgi:hypothetical protein